MKNVFRRFLIVCYIVALACGLFGFSLLVANSSLVAGGDKYARDLGAVFILSAPGVIILCYLSHFIFLGILNPLRLFKPIEK